MRKILFTHSYFYKLDAKQWRFKQPYAPLGTLLAASVARADGFEVSLFDACLKNSPQEIENPIKNFQPDCLVIYDDGFNYLTKMCLTVMREAAFTMAGLAKASGCTVIVSSSDSTDHCKDYFEHGVDYVIRGEGEETLVELLRALAQGKSVETISGIAFQNNGHECVTSSRAVIRDLDALPLPAWDLVEIEDYRKIWKKHHGYFSINLATTRGCPFKCNWCAKPIYGNRYNSRSPEHVVKEIELLIQKFAPDHFWMCDDIFGLKPGWVKEFKVLVQAKGLRFKYKIQSRVDLLLEEDNLEALAASGAETIWVGAESGSQKILDAMDKGTRVEQIYQATRMMKSKGIKVAFFLQFGYPGESSADIDLTLKMVLDLMPEEVGISVSYPLPGTKFYENVRNQLQLKQNWRDSDDLDMMFQGTFKPAYYKELHRYVHSIYGKHRGYQTMKKLLRSPLRLTYKDMRSGVAMAYFVPLSIVQRIKLEMLKN
jgi:anaerobic magnesium-protoporphyrin IX monomethyl ester cyclase